MMVANRVRVFVVISSVVAFTALGAGCLNVSRGCGCAYGKKPAAHHGHSVAESAKDGAGKGEAHGRHAGHGHGEHGHGDSKSHD